MENTICVARTLRVSYRTTSSRNAVAEQNTTPTLLASMLLYSCCKFKDYTLLELFRYTTGTSCWCCQILTWYFDLRLFFFLKKHRHRDFKVDPSHLELEWLHDGQSQPRRRCRVYRHSTESIQNTNDMTRMLANAALVSLYIVVAREVTPCRLGHEYFCILIVYIFSSVWQAPPSMGIHCVIVEITTKWSLYVSTMWQMCSLV